MKLNCVVGERQSGRTQKLLQWLDNSPEDETRIYVGHSFQYVMDVYRSTFVENSDGVKCSRFASWQFISIDEVRSGRLHKFNVVLGIDNIDFALRYVLHNPVGVITFEGGENSIEILKGE